MYKYKFVDEDCITISTFEKDERLIPIKDQHIIINNEEYLVFRVDELIDYDDFSTKVTVYLNNLG